MRKILSLNIQYKIFKYHGTYKSAYTTAHQSHLSKYPVGMIKSGDSFAVSSKHYQEQILSFTFGHFGQFCPEVLNPYKPGVLFMGHRQTE